MPKNPAPQEQEQSPRLPAHEQVYQTLRKKVLFGELAPGQAVTIQGLSQSLETGVTPVREAIRRLISDGALMFQGNRRVSVPVLSCKDLEQLIFIRKTMEQELTLRAATRLNHTAISHLEAIDAKLDHAILHGDTAGYLLRNYQFHTALYAQANAPVLADMSERLWLRFGPSLRVVCGRFGTQNLPDRHKDLLNALRNRDPQAAGEAVARDVLQGMDQVAAVLSLGADSIDR
ncbi:MAG: GntR family transcriptional regulator [Sedimentitalea sp.]